MNLKNLAMWAIIVFLTIGLYNMFKNPQSNVRGGSQVIFSEFLTSVDNGEVLKVEIQGNNINGVYSNGNTFKTFDTLASLSLGPNKGRRHQFYRSELENFLLLCRENNLNPSSIKGSYAGALGKPQFISSSYRNYAIDFDGDGINAYQFFTSSSGSIGDSTVKDEKERNWDWDSDWSAETSFQEDIWFSEIFIPWSIATMKTVEGDKRKIGLAFYRMAMGLGRGFSTIKGSPYQNVFLSVFDELLVDNYDSSEIDIFPYITINEDIANSEIIAKGGAEIFWKIDSSKELNITLNPDFGQIESDEVVVNFSSVETFYSDKRPFFSENQSLFDVKDSLFRTVSYTHLTLPTKRIV